MAFINQLLKFYCWLLIHSDGSTLPAELALMLSLLKQWTIRPHAVIHNLIIKGLSPKEVHEDKEGIHMLHDSQTKCVTVEGDYVEK